MKNKLMFVWLVFSSSIHIQTVVGVQHEYIQGFVSKHSELPT